MHEKFILIISSYNPETSQTATNITAFVDEYQSLGGEPSSIIIENMNCKSFSEVSLWKGKMKGILDKYIHASKIPDLIVILGQEAWTSYLSQDSVTKGTVPVMCGMVSRNALILPDDTVSLKDWEPESIDAFENNSSYNIIAGYAYNYDIKENIQLIKTFYPDVKNIGFISDNTYGGVAMQAWVKQEMEQFPELNLILLDGRKNSIYTIFSDIGHLPDNSVLLIGTWRIDTNDGYYMRNATYAMKEENPDIPAFTVASTGLGYWAIGGYIPSYKVIGNSLARQAYDYFFTENKGNIQIEFIDNHYAFDVEKIKEKGFNLSQLPEGSELVNKEIPFYEEYKYEIISLFVIFAIILMAFLVSLYYFIRTKRLKDKLEISEKELRIAKDKAEESNQLKTAFIANMSHEIRTPLNAIVGFSNVLVSSPDATEEQKSYFEIIQTNSDLLLHLINDILDISRLESGRMKFALEDCDVVSLCRGALSSVEYTRKTPAKFIFEPDRDVFMIYTDIQRLQQVLNNLLSNAAKFTTEGSITLAYEVNEKEQMIYFSVTDTGSGIPKEKRALVFERFEKLDEYMQGTGLGLSICKLIVGKLGGKIWVDGEYDKGARFVFTHPLHLTEI